MALRRIQLFEFHDLKWFPGIFRNGITALLEFGTNRINVYKAFTAILAEEMISCGHTHLLDLCSGSGGGVRSIYKGLRRKLGENASITLTDIYPNINAFERIAASSGGKIDFLSQPIDATHVPKYLSGFRSLFASFHHFNPEEATKILKDAVENGVPISICEITERSLTGLATAIFLHPFSPFTFTLFIRPVRLASLVFTYFIPLTPICFAWDTLVSTLRTYTPDEMKTMAIEAGGSQYTWKADKIRVGGLFSLSYLIGYPM